MFLKSTINRRMHNKILCFSLLVSVFILFSCEFSQKKVSSDFIEAYCELRIITERYGKTTEIAKEERKKALEKHSLTPLKFDAEVKRIKNTPKIWNELQDSIVVKLDSMTAKKLREIKEETKNNIKSVKMTTLTKNKQSKKTVKSLQHNSKKTKGLEKNENSK